MSNRGTSRSYSGWHGIRLPDTEGVFVPAPTCQSPESRWQAGTLPQENSPKALVSKGVVSTEAACHLPSTLARWLPRCPPEPSRSRVRKPPHTEREDYPVRHVHANGLTVRTRRSRSTEDSARLATTEPNRIAETAERGERPPKLLSRIVAVPTRKNGENDWPTVKANFDLTSHRPFPFLGAFSC